MARKRDLRRVDAVCREFRMTPEQEYAFRDYLHECKESGYFGTEGGGDFTIEQMRELAREFLGC